MTIWGASNNHVIGKFPGWWSVYCGNYTLPFEDLKLTPDELDKKLTEIKNQKELDETRKKEEDEKRLLKTLKEKYETR